MSDNSSNNKRIAKNTALLYLRTIIVMLVTLYTSRVILKNLGVDDYGIYNVVGGFVAMFSVVSGALSTSISRFITFNLGKGDEDKLKVVFQTGLFIQVVLSILLFILAESAGLYFLNNYMNIPAQRMAAANVVYQCSIMAFICSLISVPYNATIIAHERMNAFAYISLFEVLLKLAVATSITYSSFDKLSLYSILLLVTAIIVLLLYAVYSTKTFSTVSNKVKYHKTTFREMGVFAGWGFLSNAAYIFNTQGVNILINIFFGVAFNAARGIANQMEQAVLQFVNSFTTAINPQITKLCASNQKEAMFNLICQGAKYSYLLFLIISIPLVVETDYILTLWLGEYPNLADTFFKLAIIGTAITTLGNSSYTGCAAAGNMKTYVAYIVPFGFLVFPLTYLVFKLGFPVYWAYIINVCVGAFQLFLRLLAMKKIIALPPMLFIRKVLLKVLSVTIIILGLPLFLSASLDQGIFRLLAVFLSTILSWLVCVPFIGMNKYERTTVINFIKNKLYR